jgi:hypothetical protein
MGNQMFQFFHIYQIWSSTIPQLARSVDHDVVHRVEPKGVLVLMITLLEEDAVQQAVL